MRAEVYIYIYSHALINHFQVCCLLHIPVLNYFIFLFGGAGLTEKWNQSRNLTQNSQMGKHQNAVVNDVLFAGPLLLCDRKQRDNRSDEFAFDVQRVHKDDGMTLADDCNLFKIGAKHLIAAWHLPAGG